MMSPLSCGAPDLGECPHFPTPSQPKAATTAPNQDASNVQELARISQSKDGVHVIDQSRVLQNFR